MYHTAPVIDPTGTVNGESATDEITVETDGSVMRLVPSGRFHMGDPADAMTVRLRAYYIDKLEVTNKQYAKFLAAVKGKGDAAWRHPDQPASKKQRFGRNPTLSALTRAAWRAAVQRLRAFRLAYRVAYQAWRTGKQSVEFPAGTWWVVRYAGAAAAT